MLATHSAAVGRFTFISKLHAARRLKAKGESTMNVNKVRSIKVYSLRLFSQAEILLKMNIIIDQKGGASYSSTIIQ